MSSRVILLGSIAFLVAGYVVYGRFVARVVGVDPSRPTPSKTKYDGVDYVPAKHWLVLFGHHFSSICAAGPIVGPALAVAYWGWAPSLLWILIGGVLLGAVADFTSLVTAVRHEGTSISDITGKVVTPRARILFSIFIFIALILVLAVFTVLTAGTFVDEPAIVLPSWGILPIAAIAGFLLYRGKDSLPRLVVVTLGGLLLLAGLMELGQNLPLTPPTLGALDPATLWMILLLAYCFVASVLPVQYLLQPRDYLSSYVLFATIGCGIIGVLLAGPVLTAGAYRGFTPSDWPAAGAMWPMLFVTIACGAISGFHSVVSSGTTCKQIASEAHACRIGYGAMLLESMVAVLVLIAVGGGLSVARHAALLRSKSGAIGAFGEGYGSITSVIFGSYGKPLAIMALNFFMLTTLDTATRLARYLLQEITGLKNRYLPTAAVIGLTALLAFGGRWRAIWPVFGASNQLVGALALLVTSCWLLQNGRRIRYTLIPALLLLVTTIGAFVLQIAGALGRKDAAGAADPNLLIAIVDMVLVVLALFVLAEAWRVLATGRRGGGPGGSPSATPTAP